MVYVAWIVVYYVYLCLWFVLMVVVCFVLVVCWLLVLVVLVLGWLVLVTLECFLLLLFNDDDWLPVDCVLLMVILAFAWVLLFILFDLFVVCLFGFCLWILVVWDVGFVGSYCVVLMIDSCS